MNHPNPKDRNSAIKWARKILKHKDKCVILDTETTGLKRNDVIIQIGIIDLTGQVLLDSLVKPTKRKRISKQATQIHKISMRDLEDQPILKDLSPKIKLITKNKAVLIFNSEYDIKLFDQTSEQDEIDYFEFKTACVMLQYSKFIGKWNEYHGDYTFQGLPGGDHSAIGDCRATLKVIHKMASSTLMDEPLVFTDSKKWWQFWK